MHYHCTVSGQHRIIFKCPCRQQALPFFMQLQRRIQAMEMRCYRKILHISYKDHVTNDEVCAKIQQATGPHQDLLMIVKRRKLQWYDYVSCSSGLAKTILQGTVKGIRRQGRQRKRRVVENRKNRENWLQNHLWCQTTLTVKGLMMMKKLQ